MKLVCWNCRGLGRPSAVRALRDVIHSHRPQIVGLIETKRKQRDWDVLRCRLGFRNCFAVDRVGYSGGLAVLWRDDLDVWIRSFSRFHVDMIVRVEVEFRCTILYGNPMSSRRKESWRLMETLSQNWEGPWLMMGDFNEVRFSWEARGIRERDSSRMRSFNQTLDKCGLMDLGFKGSPFTYSNRRPYPFEAKARLDRALGNLELRNLVPRISVQHSFALHSDHCPLIVQFGKGRQTRQRKKLFTYEVMWHRHPKFASEIQTIWSQSADRGVPLAESLSNCAVFLEQWNKLNFGSVQRKIKKLKADLKDICSQPRTHNVISREAQLAEELDEWLKREEFSWRHRSRAEWLKEGDQNTAFFHAKASHRRRINQIEKLKVGDRVVTDAQEILEVVEEYFGNMFQSIGSVSDDFLEDSLRIIPEVISEEVRQELIRPYTREQVRKALFQLAPMKAPGIDGFQAIFYQRHWTIVGDLFSNEILHFLNGGQFDKRLNLTRIALVPKCKNALKIEEFRPISVCNTPVKVISKVLANRIQGVLQQVISQSQSAFVKGRLITDNILIAHELGHFIKNMKSGSDGVVSLKLDMSKAYDRVEWRFLESILKKFGFPTMWVSLVMEIVTSVVYRVRVNDYFTNDIIPSRGLRQGDPMSPYLFIICAEWLARTLQNKNECNSIKGIRIARGAPSISHLLFADDSMIYARANRDEMREIRSVLDDYEKISGQKINYEKSEMVCSKNIDPCISDEIKCELGVKIVEKHTRYLGLPVVIGQNKKEVFKTIEERIQKKISDWKYRLLSFAGREILIKSTLQSMPIYPMQCFLIPKGVTQNLERTFMNFLWSHSGKERTTHWVKKETVMRDKLEGGLGIRRLDCFNWTLLMKQANRILNEPDLLVSKVLKARYYRMGSLLEARLGARPSYAWRGVHMAKGLLNSVINDQRDARELGGNDFSCKRVYKLVTRMVPIESANEGESSEKDKMKRFWEVMWKLTLPSKIKFFAWRLFHNGLPDAMNMIRRQCDIDDKCYECGYKGENVLHILKNCWKAKVVWRDLGINGEVIDADIMNPADWLWLCIHKLSLTEFRTLVCGCWWLWFVRNRCRHGVQGIGYESVVYSVKAYILQCDKWINGMNRVMQGLWGIYQPRNNVRKVFCDASYERNEGRAGFAVLCMSDHAIDYVYAGWWSSCSNELEAEIFAILQGLLLLNRLRVSEAIIVSDSLEAVSSILRGATNRRAALPWIDQCFKLMEANKSWLIDHVLREDNVGADAVAKWARRGRSWTRTDAIPLICTSFMAGVNQAGELEPHRSQS